VLEGSVRSALLTIMGELVLPTREPVWTSSLLYVLSGLGISEQAARQSIARAANAGWIHGEKRGREVSWFPTPATVDLIGEITRRVMSLNNPAERWDGNCIIAHITIDRTRETVRRRLYNALGWAGFGNPAPGLWTSPHVDRMAELCQIVHEVGLHDAAVVFTGQTAKVGLSDDEIVRRAWNLDEVAQRYQTLLANFADLRPRPGDEMLFTYLRLVEEWRKFPAMDPQLPRNLLPSWIGRQAADTFAQLYEAWRPDAHGRWRDIVAATAPPSHPAAAAEDG
jgi:phenylacetic acid degradation operon negative regulatory protein